VLKVIIPIRDNGNIKNACRCNLSYKALINQIIVGILLAVTDVTANVRVFDSLVGLHAVSVHPHTFSSEKAFYNRA
jgi:hypothetical protein